MLFFIRYQGKEHQVRVESRGSQLHVSFDGEKEEAVDMVFYGNDVTFLRDNKVFQANIVGKKSDFTVWRPKGNLSLTVESEYRRIVGMLRGQQMDNEKNVFAKMPGKVLKMGCKVGDTVKKGDTIMVMEAMKMENEIKALVTGKIVTIHVKEGQAVETGSLLAELEASADEE